MPDDDLDALAAEHVEAADHPERLRSVGRARGRIESRSATTTERASDRRDRRDLRNGTIVMKGYWDDPAATSDVFRVGWYHTGDLGRYDDDGFLYLLDRARK